MGANEGAVKDGELVLTPTDSYEEGLPIPDDSAEEPHLDDLPPVDNLVKQFAPGKEKEMIIVPSKGYYDEDYEDLMTPDSSDSILAISDRESSDTLVEASWVDENFFASEV